MRKRIRVHTLTLPFHDDIASFILSNDEYDVLISERVALPKSGLILFHLQYEDNSDDSIDKVAELIKSRDTEGDDRGEDGSSYGNSVTGEYGITDDGDVMDIDDIPMDNVFPFETNKSKGKERKKK